MPEDLMSPKVESFNQNVQALYDKNFPLEELLDWLYLTPTTPAIVTTQDNIEHEFQKLERDTNLNIYLRQIKLYASKLPGNTNLNARRLHIAFSHHFYHMKKALDIICTTTNSPPVTKTYSFLGIRHQVSQCAALKHLFSENNGVTTLPYHKMEACLNSEEIFQLYETAMSTLDSAIARTKGEVKTALQDAKTQVQSTIRGKSIPNGLKDQSPTPDQRFGNI